MKIQLAVATAVALFSSANAAISPLASFAADVAVDAEEEEGCCSGTRQQCRGKTRCGSKADCYDRCLNAGHGIKFCKNACYKMEEEDIIDLYYEIGGFSVYPEDEDFDFYTN